MKSTNYFSSDVQPSTLTSTSITSSARKNGVDPAVSNVSIFKNPIVHQLWTARQKAKLEDDNKAIDLTPKSPAESRVEVRYNFSENPLLLESYRNPWGQMRLGKMMEDLDALAGNIAYQHVNSARPIIVTASVDRIRLHHRPTLQMDQELSGQVVWTGSSSMEIHMQCKDTSSELPWLEAHVTFVTLDPQTHRPCTLPPVQPKTASEHEEFREGAARAEAKKRHRKATHKRSVSPEIEELAESLLEQAQPLLKLPSLADPSSILMSTTRMQNAMIAQPQVQNLHKRIFGGFLMRRAMELAFSNAYIFGGARPIFLEVDDISFQSPVDVGDLIVFNSRVLYTERGKLSDYYTYIKDDRTLPILHIEVEAWVTEPEKATTRLSNSFYFTFGIDKPFVRHVLPSTIDEAHRMAMRMKVDEEHH